MATHVGVASGSADASGTTLSTSGTIAVTAGDLIVGFFKHEGAVSTISFSDNAGGGSNSYTGLTAVSNTSTSDIHSRMFWAIAKATETLTFSAAPAAARQYRGIAVAVGRPTASYTFEFDNQATSDDPGGTVAHSTGSYATTSGNGYAVSAFAAYTVTTWTAGSGWTEGVDNNFYLEYRVLTASSSLTGDATSAVSTESTNHSAAFKEVAAAASGTVLTRSSSVMGGGMQDLSGGMRN